MKNRNARNSMVFSIAIASLSFASAAFAGTYWVSPTGTSSWFGCKSVSPLSGTSACSLPIANSNAVAGDVINLYGGTYNISISPKNSGSTGSLITYQAYTGETPTISGDNVTAIFLNNNDYIKIDGMTVDNVYRWANIRNGSDYNEIANSNFTDDNGIVAGKGIHIWGQCFAGAKYNCPSTHNWIHDNSFSKNGWVSDTCDDMSGIMYIGSITTGDSGSNYNTIEDNTFSYGGHHNLETNTKYNVVRNNVFHNEGWMTDPGNCTWGPSPRNGKYGNRNVQIYDAHDGGMLYNLVENNRLGHAAFAPDGGMDGNLIIASQGNIVRYNLSFNSETMGLYFKQGLSSSSSNNRVYNNTIFNSGQNSQVYPVAWTGWATDLDWRLGVYIANPLSVGNVIKNNIIYNSFTSDIKCNTACKANNTFTNNWVTANGDPLFTNPDVSDPTSITLPDLRVQSGSGVIDKAVNLTNANGSGTSSTTLIVDDALYFQDGSRGSSLSNIQPDWIAIGTVGNRVQISSINYSTNTITLESPMTWSNNANIWLYKDSSGKIVLWGSAPDIGAYEFNTSSGSGGSGASGSGGASGNATPRSGSGCGCVVAGGTRDAGSGLALFAFGALLLGFRRRRVVLTSR